MKRVLSRLVQFPTVLIIIGVATLLCITLLVFLVSPTTIDSQKRPTPTPPDLSLSQTKQVDNLSVMLVVTPGKIHVANTVTVKITDTRTGQFVTNARIMISSNMDQMDMGTTQAIMTEDTSVYSATFVQNTTFSMTGTWDITLTIQRSQEAQDTIAFQVWLNG